MTFRNIIRLIKWVFIKDKNNYYYNIFLEKALNKLPKKHLKYKCYIMSEFKFLKKLMLI